MHGLLDFPCDSAFAVPIRIGLRGNTFKSPSTCVQRSSSPALEQAARGDYERSVRGDIQVTTGCTAAVPRPRRSSLAHPRYSLPNSFDPVVSHPYAITATTFGCPLVVPVPRSTHLTHLLTHSFSTHRPT